MNKFEFMRNLEIYRSNKPKDVLQHDSYDIPKQETHKIQSEYSKAPKVYKDQISLYEEYNEESLEHAGYKPAGTHEYIAKIDNAFGPGKHRYFYTKEEWDNYNKNKGYAQNAEKKKTDPKVKIKEQIESSQEAGDGWFSAKSTQFTEAFQSTPEYKQSLKDFEDLQRKIIKENPFFTDENCEEIYNMIEEEIDKHAKDFMKKYDIKQGLDAKGYENHFYEGFKNEFRSLFMKAAKNYFNYEALIDTIKRKKDNKEWERKWLYNKAQKGKEEAIKNSSK